MAREIEVFRIPLQKDLCYEHIEATRSEYIRARGNYRYFSTNAPRYVGKYVRTEQVGFGDGATITAIFDDGGKENRVEYSYEGFTCFNQVECLLNKEQVQAIRNVYGKKTNMNASPGSGPANLIIGYAGKVGKGGSSRSRKNRKQKKKSKKTRHH